MTIFSEKFNDAFFPGCHGNQAGDFVVSDPRGLITHMAASSPPVSFPIFVYILQIQF